MVMANFMSRLFRHRLLDERDAERALGVAGRSHIAARVAASEARHSGQIRVCIEAGLPLGYLRRGASPRERAVALFGKLRVWDTEHNNGVLVYVLLAEHAIEIVADRGIDRRVDAAAWDAIAAQMKEPFRGGDFAAGLDRAINAVDALLVRHFPRASGEAGAPRANELPDAPDVR
jgi:uncharacterized membrane protein